MAITKTDYTAQINQKLADWYFERHNPFTYRPVHNKYTVVGDRVEEVREIIVHTFTVGDVEDPDLYAASPLIEWEKSELGQWIMRNACDTPTWHRTIDHSSFMYKYQIRAKLMGPALTEWLLKYGK